MIKVWNFDFNQVPGAANPDYDDFNLVQRAYNHNIDLMVSMERRGFEGIFFSEHHFIASMSPCPNLLIAAVAPQTKTLKLGVMGNVLPFHQPWRIAEELHMLDYLTEGRLEIGVAPGVPPEFIFLNFKMEDIRPMYKEILDFIDMAADHRDVTLKGKFFDLEAIPSMPRPRKEARRRNWMTVYSESSCREAARRNYKVCTGYQSCESAALAFDGYREEAANLGRDVGPDDIGLRRQVLVWDTDSEAEAVNTEMQASAVARLEDIFRAVGERLAKAGGGPSEGVKQSGIIDAAVVPNAEDANKPKSKSIAPSLVSADEQIFGSPKTVADKIIDQCRRIGAGNLMAYHVPTLSEAQLAHHYDLWEKVIPILAKADVFAKEPA